jgi:hypothetical protein
VRVLSLFAKNNARFSQIVRRKLYGNFVAGNYPDEMFPHFTGDMCKHIALSGEIDTKHGTRQYLSDGAFCYDLSFLRHAAEYM